mmetsp:Transcript_12168/g.18810  ORF Transcript_12168/g.18810 Transcript_12168/m.18810 type:complete len:100 (+) Transcript_12168:790-1089(+)
MTTQGYFVCIDSRTRFVNQTSIMDMINDDMGYGKSERDAFSRFDSSIIENKRVTVITSHNSKSYQVDKMISDLNPKTVKFVSRRTKKEVTMQQYFYEEY